MSDPAAYATYDARGDGWLAFSATMLFLVGVFNVLQGFLLIAADEIYVGESDASTVVIGNVTTWGWIILIVGVLEIVAGGGVLARHQLARWFGIFVASVGLLSQFPVFFGAHPVWSFTVVMLCAMVIYGLTVYGGKDRA